MHRLAVIERLALSFDYAQLPRSRCESRFNYREAEVASPRVVLRITNYLPYISQIAIGILAS
ncbi:MULTISPECIES: hypothetical protein [unclassified Nostoc]|uniref:hypothetical protein n=1 Tax=unclassified Nostoc TaxID=2593658 RepID=UPI002AD4F191|nr:hypothetical protein [Nostoc sp. DedQUE03]MDZ7971895.1 hypothetical protein [Nostoc sp. DedQUE03]MDZ8046876.1 hypothetical protein [Nostoc sp. DedQUE02]